MKKVSLSFFFNQIAASQLENQILLHFNVYLNLIDCSAISNVRCLTNEYLHGRQGVILPVAVVHLFLLDLLGIGADGIKLPPLFNELLSGLIRHFEALARESPVQAVRA